MDDALVIHFLLGEHLVLKRMSVEPHSGRVQNDVRQGHSLTDTVQCVFSLPEYISTQVVSLFVSCNRVKNP